MTGDLLGPYRLTRLIHLGSVSQFWEANEESTNENVAIKVLRPEQRINQDEIAILKWEYDIGCQLNHPNIVGFKDFITNAATPFVVMELFSELNVTFLLRERPQLIEQSVSNIFFHVADALSYLYSKGFVHCDVKPDNILVSRDSGDIRLIDFITTQKMRSWLARLFGSKQRLQGTRAYMAPEQIRQESLNGYTDVYSLGCTFFEMLTGHTPFIATAPNEMLSKHLSAPIPSASHDNSNLTDDIDQLIKSMMAKDAKRRPSMRAVLKTLQGVNIFKVPPAPFSQN